ncbi:Nramp family divalent metal transporter [uncultured Arcticibacterium sp.]|uniref:Nramp family divalent metal transporter n=1 Tax=uncultured Arcticibacterium sp. TaxID=2173042 RepID=UPI0030F8168E
MLKKLGPGLLVAAAGIGAGDMIIGIQIGLDFQWVFVAAVLLATVLKYIITVGIAKFQIETGTSIIQFWNTKIPFWLRLIFILFFLIWSFMVGAALLSASGLAANSLLPFWSKETWAVVHSLLAFLMIYFGKYQSIENLTKVLILLLFVILIPTALVLLFKSETSSEIVSAAYDTPTLIMSIIGGVGGSVTMLSYTYWLEEKNWNKENLMPEVRFDLRFSYFITALFIFALMIIASRLDMQSGELNGSKLIFSLGEVIGNVLGSSLKLLFKICFWGVAFSSVITVWSGVPYLFQDFYQGIFKSKSRSNVSPAASKQYRAFLLFISIAPLILTFLQNTIKNVINYTLISSIFVVGISVTLLLLSGKKGKISNDVFSKFILAISVLVFASLLLWQVFH